MVVAEGVYINKASPESELSWFQHKIGTLKIILNKQVKNKVHIDFFPGCKFQGVFFKEFPVDDFFGKCFRVCHYKEAPRKAVQPVQDFGPQQQTLVILCPCQDSFFKR